MNEDRITFAAKKIVEIFLVEGETEQSEKVLSSCCLTLKQMKRENGIVRITIIQDNTTRIFLQVSVFTCVSSSAET